MAQPGPVFKFQVDPFDKYIEPQAVHNILSTVVLGYFRVRGTVTESEAGCPPAGQLLVVFSSFASATVPVGTRI